MEMFPYLRADILDQDSYYSMTISTLDSRTATNQFMDYKYCSSNLENVCLYNYSSIVYTSPLSDVPAKGENSESLIQFSNRHLLHKQLAQWIYQSRKEYKIIAFS